MYICKYFLVYLHMYIHIKPDLQKMVLTSHFKGVKWDSGK